MYDVVKIVTGIVISEWHTKEKAQEQVDRFNKSANGEYYEVRYTENEPKVLIPKKNIKLVTISRTFNKENLNHPNFDIRKVTKREMLDKFLRKLYEKGYITCNETENGDEITMTTKIKVICQ